MAPAARQAAQHSSKEAQHSTTQHSVCCVLWCALSHCVCVCPQPVAAMPGGPGSGTSSRDVSSWSRQVIAVAFAAEAVACLNRRNLSMASTRVAADALLAAHAAAGNATYPDAAPRATEVDVASLMLRSDEQVGELATVAALAYAFSKPVQSLLSDVVSSRVQLGASMVGTGICNILLASACTSHRSFVLVMCANGLLQGGVFPAIARLLISWYPEAVRGSYWSVVAVSSNVGYGALPVLATLVMDRVGSWRVAFALPGLCAVAVGLCAPVLLRDSPAQARDDEGLSLLPWTHDDGEAELEDAAGKVKARGLEKQQREGGYSSAMAAVCGGRAGASLWLVAGAIGCLFFVFRGVSTWGQLWLVEARGLSPVRATSTYALVELGGMLGAAMAGPLTDRCLDRAGLSAGALALLAVLMGWWLPTASPGVALDATLLAVGAMITVPKVSLPLLARADLLPLSLVGVSGAVVDLMGELGGTCSGVAIGRMLSRPHQHHHHGGSMPMPSLATRGGGAVQAATPGIAQAQPHARRLAAALGDASEENWQRVLALFAQVAALGVCLLVLFMAVRPPRRLANA